MAKLTMNDVNKSILNTLNPINPITNPPVAPNPTSLQQPMVQTPLGMRNPVASMPNMLRYLASMSPDMKTANVQNNVPKTEVTIPQVEKMNFPAV